MAKRKPAAKKTKTKAEATTKMGRPTLYRPEFCQGVVDHMRKNYSFPSYAAVIDVNPDTLYEWANTYPDFSDAKKKGEAQSLFHMETIGNLGMTGKLPGFNFSAWIASMNNKHRNFGWRRGDAPVKEADPSSDLNDALAALDAEERSNIKPEAASLPRKAKAKPATNVATEDRPPKLPRRSKAKDA